jgi:hypothetical protein
MRDHGRRREQPSKRFLGTPPNVARPPKKRCCAVTPIAPDHLRLAPQAQCYRRSVTRTVEPLRRSRCSTTACRVETTGAHRYPADVRWLARSHELATREKPLQRPPFLAPHDRRAGIAGPSSRQLAGRRVARRRRHRGPDFSNFATTTWPKACVPPEPRPIGLDRVSSDRRGRPRPRGAASRLI